MPEEGKQARRDGYANMSVEAKEAHKEASAAAASKPRSDIFKANMSKIAARRVAEGTLGPATSKPAFTKPELEMAGLLEAADIEYDPQHLVGAKVADFWLPDSKTVIEVDGVYWHNRSDPDGSKSRERDKYLLKNGVSRVIHVTDKQLASGGWSVKEEVVPYVRGLGLPFE